MSAFFDTALGALHHDDACRWLSGLRPGTATLIVADPPYNLGKASWDSFDSQDKYLEWTREWVGKAHRVLAEEGTMYICGFPEPMAAITARVASLFATHRSLVWFYRNKANVGNDWGRSHESILHLRKSRRMVFNADEVRVPYNRHTLRYPERTQADSSQFSRGRNRSEARPAWRPHPDGARPRDVLEIPTLCNGSSEKTHHPTQKPEELIRRLVLASSRPGDLVIDPFGGSGTTYVICEETGRRWLGCEQDAGYCRLIAERVAEPERFRSRSADETVRQRGARRQRLRGTH